MFRISDLRRKDVINENDGRKLGYVHDIEIDINTGSVDAIVIPGESRFLGFFVRSEEVVLPWERIKKIGLDVIIIGDEESRPIISKAFEQKDFSLKETSKAVSKPATYDWDDWEL